MSYSTRTLSSPLVTRLLAGTVASFLLIGSPAYAAEFDAEDDDGEPSKATVSLIETRGISCMVGGGIAGAWVMAAPASALATAAATAVSVLPVVATAIVAGCGAGAVLSPAIWWITHQWQDHGRPVQAAPARRQKAPDAVDDVQEDKAVPPHAHPPEGPRIELISLQPERRTFFGAVNRLLTRDVSRRESAQTR
jgi:hypothetical protein